VARAFRSARLEGGLAPIATIERGVVSVRPGRWLARLTPTTLWLAGAVVLAAVLRFGTLSVQSFDLDESVTVALLHQGFHTTLTTIPITEKTPPLYYVLAWLWSQIFGLNEAGLRSFSALAGTLTVPLAYDAGKQLVSKRTGLIVAGLTAASPFLVWYSQEARAYALLGLLTAASFVLFVRLSARSTGRLMAAWGLVSALALTTHYFAVFLVAPEALWLLVRVRPRRSALTGGTVGIVGLALLPLARQQAHHFHSKEAFLGIPLVSRLTSIPVQFLLGPEVTSTSKLLLVAIGGACVVAGLLCLVYYADHRVLAAVGAAGLIGAAAVLVPVVLALLSVDYLDPRNVLPAWLPLAVVPAAGFAVADSRWSWLGLLGLTTVFLSMIFMVNTDRSLQRANYRDGAGVLARTKGPDEAIVVTPSYNWTPLTHYLPSAPVMSGDTATVRTVILLSWRGEQLRGAAVRLLARYGFHLAAQRRLQKLQVVVFRSDQAKLLSRRFLDKSGLGLAHAIVLIR
jgi:4-amino-4-deoxy-L-arabinose transferase-like glycosyltransferase